MACRCKGLRIWKLLVTPIAVVLCAALLTVISKLVLGFYNWLTSMFGNRADLLVLVIWIIIVSIIMACNRFHSHSGSSRRHTDVQF